MDKNKIVKGLDDAASYLTLKILSDDLARDMIAPILEAAALLKRQGKDTQKIIQCMYCKHGRSCRYRGEARIRCYNCRHPQPGFLDPEWFCGDGELKETEGRMLL